jgi:hypothetical protein
MPTPKQSLATLAVAAAALSFVGSQANGARTSACAASSLVAWLDTNGDGAAGSVYYQLEFTNVSGGSCVLRGYPGVSAVDTAGRQVGSAAGRNAGAPVKNIVLASGGTASALLKIANTGVYPAGRCHSTTAAGFRVYAPGQTASKLVPYPFQACSKVGTVYLQVRAVTTAKRP